MFCSGHSFQTSELKYKELTDSFLFFSSAFVRSEKPKMFKGLQIKVATMNRVANVPALFATVIILRRCKPDYADQMSLSRSSPRSTSEAQILY